MASNSARRVPARRRKSQRRSRGSRPSGGVGLTPWLVLLVVVVGGIALYDNRVSAWRTGSPYLSSGGNPQVAVAPDKPKAERAVAPRPESETPRRGPIPPERVPETAGAPLPVAKPTVAVAGQPTAAPTAADKSTIGEGLSGRFYFCGTTGLDNCVAEGDTFWYHSTRITLADVVSPRTEGARCQQERDLGFKAKVRLKELLNGGRFNLQQLRGQTDERTTTVSRVVTRDGRSLGSILVSEGLAKPRMGRHQAWCP